LVPLQAESRQAKIQAQFYQTTLLAGSKNGAASGRDMMEFKILAIFFSASLDDMIRK
jgi:hypothetical protein